MRGVIETSSQFQENLEGNREMRKKRLLVLSSSKQRSTDPRLLPAIERYQGVMFRVARKYLLECQSNDVEIVIVSEREGIMCANDPVPYHEPLIERPTSRHISEDTLRKSREKFNSILSEHPYSEIFVACSNGLRGMIGDLEKIDAKVVFCDDPGLGRRAQRLKQWIAGRDSA